MNDKKNETWCKLNNSPCIHTQSDDTENCLYCENYSFRKYIRYKISKSNREHKGE